MNVQQETFRNPMARGMPIVKVTQPAQLPLEDLEASAKVAKASSSFTFRNVLLAVVGVAALVGGGAGVASTVSYNREKAAALEENAVAQGSYTALKANSAGMR